MRKKLYFLSQLLFMGVFACPIGVLKAQGQTPKEAQKASERTVKLKIIKEENGKHFFLDTTLVIPAGKSLEEVAKGLKEAGVPFKALESKSFPGQVLRSGKPGEMTRFSASFGQDSLRTIVFRSITSDSLFARKIDGKEVWVKSIPADRLRELHVKGEGSPLNAITIYRSLQADSGRKQHRIFRMDSTHTLIGDTFSIRETIRVEKSGPGGDVKIFRLKKGDTKALLEEGEYEVITLKGGQPTQILMLKPSKESKKEAAKAQSKNKKKEAESIPSLGVQVYPNPSSGVVHVSFKAPKKSKAQLRVVDSNGKTVYQEDLGTIQGAYSKQLDLSRFGKGVYVIQVLVGNSAQSGKVVLH